MGPLGLRLPSLPRLPAAGPKTRFAQTVWTLAPHATTPLGGVEWDLNRNSERIPRPDESGLRG